MGMVVLAGQLNRDNRISLTGNDFGVVFDPRCGVGAMFFPDIFDSFLI
jgi:hypothetical protein